MRAGPGRAGAPAMGRRLGGRGRIVHLVLREENMTDVEAERNRRIFRIEVLREAKDAVRNLEVLGTPDKDTREGHYEKGVVAAMGAISELIRKAERVSA